MFVLEGFCPVGEVVDDGVADYVASGAEFWYPSDELFKLGDGSWLNFDVAGFGVVVFVGGLYVDFVSRVVGVASVVVGEGVWVVLRFDCSYVGLCHVGAFPVRGVL